MKSKFLIPAIIIAVLMFINFSDCQVYGQAPQNVPAQKQTVKYTCPMHPEVVQDLPGICPKCGMKLVEKKDMHQSKDSTMMKKDHMMHDSTMMKKDHRMHDSTMMKKDHRMHDSTMMKKDHMMHDSTMMKKDHMMHD